jgi:hypothetical protein
MARFLRNPEAEPPPAGIEPRRLQIYQNLVYNNIEGFISGGFPVLRSLYQEREWHALVRRFIDGHRCHTPYFLEISQEFVRFLLEQYEPRPDDPPFLGELAHYEWVELALDVSEETHPDYAQGPKDLPAAVPSLSPLAWVLRYRYPVHRIGPAFRPEQPAEPCYLLVYRDRDDRVGFMEVNAAVARLLELVRDNTDRTVADLLALLAVELALPVESVLEFGCEQLRQFIELSVVVI